MPSSSSMKTFYITLLLCASAYCVFGKTLPNATINLDDIFSPSHDAPTVLSPDKTCAVKDKTPFVAMVRKPKLVVTFLANTKTIDPLTNDYEPPFFLDPFQRLLQFFFSSFARDFGPSPAMMKEDERDEREKRNDTTNNISKDLAELFGKFEEHDANMNDSHNLPEQSTCDHNPAGFCKNCHISVKTLAVSGKTTLQEKMNAPNPPAKETSAAAKTSHMSTRTNDVTFTPRAKPVHKRHYFLSISGGTDQRATAPNCSENNNVRVKRNSSMADSDAGPENGQSSIFKILENTIYESLNKDGQLNNDTEILRKSQDARKQVENKQRKELEDDFNVTTTEITDVYNDNYNDTNLEGEDDYDEDEPHDRPYDFGVTGHPADFSHGWKYFLIVTLPVSCRRVAGVANYS